MSPRTPSPHLVSYFLPVDPASGSVLLADHRKSGLWLPPGGHIEPGEHPAETVRRETREELGIDARFSPLTGERPAFVTVTPKAVPGPGRAASTVGGMRLTVQPSAWRKRAAQT